MANLNAPVGTVELMHLCRIWPGSNSFKTSLTLSCAIHHKAVRPRNTLGTHSGSLIWSLTLCKTFWQQGWLAGQLSRSVDKKGVDCLLRTPHNDQPLFCQCTGHTSELWSPSVSHLDIEVGAANVAKLCAPNACLTTGLQRLRVKTDGVIPRTSLGDLLWGRG